MKSLDELRGTTLYLDSNILIYAFEAQAGALRQAIGQIIRMIYLEQCTASTSLITRAEVLVRPLQLRQTELADRYRALLSGYNAVFIHKPDEQTVELAAELRADYPALKLLDALHIATAIQASCTVFVTGDLRLSVVSARIPVLTVDQLPNV